MKRAVYPFVVPLETVVDVEDENMPVSEPLSLFVSSVISNEKKGIAVDDELVPECKKQTLGEGLRPLLASMKLFGLHFSRPSKDADGKWNAYIVYAATIVTLMWINVVRMLSVFTHEDKFGMDLFYKLITVIWSIQCAISQTAFYAISFSGRLEVVFRQQLDCSCAKHARKSAIIYSTIGWSMMMSSSAMVAYALFFTGGVKDSMLAPLQSYIIISDPLIPRIIVYFFNFYLLSACIFTQMVTFVLAMVFSHQFKKVTKSLESCLKNQQRQVSDCDIETFRQKHQEISMRVDHVDDCLMFSNASAFCCQLSCLIILLYMLIFYHSLVIDPVLITSQIFLMFLFTVGLTLMAAGGITVHHYVSVTYMLFCITFAKKLYLPHI